MTATTDSSRPNDIVHGVLVSIEGIGVLITGEAGTGKSECALELVLGGHKLVADDVVCCTRKTDALVGEPPAGFEGLLAIRDVGIVDVRDLRGVDGFLGRQRIDLYVQLVDRECVSRHDLVGFTKETISILGLNVPKFVISVRNDRSIRPLVELLARSYASKPAYAEKAA